MTMPCNKKVVKRKGVVCVTTKSDGGKEEKGKNEGSCFRR